MLPYDAILLSAVSAVPQSIAGVIAILQTIQNTCEDGDGLKWFNWLYLEVTEAVQERVQSGSLNNAEWITELDLQFARLYFGALESRLSGQSTPGCWNVLFERRTQAQTARIQFALAGINAHINHDLAQAIVITCQIRNTVPQHDGPQYEDYISLNSTLSGLIEMAKRSLNVRLLGDEIPAASRLEDTLAAWSVTAAREAAWNNALLLWHLRPVPALASKFVDTLDGLSALTSKTILSPVF